MVDVAKSGGGVSTIEITGENTTLQVATSVLHAVLAQAR
jgi:DtxR family Mn-dependent transcriptional regulator